MYLSKENIKEFKRIYRKKFDKDISDKYVREQVMQLVSLVKIILRAKARGTVK